MSEPDRLYTVDEARAMVPRLIPVLRRIVESTRTVRGQQQLVAAAARGASADGHALADPFEKDTMQKLNRTFEEAVALVNSWGIEIKDPERGLVDFYAERNGQIVYLCFLLG